MAKVDKKRMRVLCCRLMKDKGLKKKLNKTELIDDDIDDTNEEDTTTSFSDDEELQEKLERKYGLRS